MATVGYARVSARDQHLDVQLAKLAHCEKLFTDKHTGTTDRRPGFDACMTYLREGDTLIITRLDRLARSTLHLCQIAETLRSQGVELQVLDQHIDTSTATGRLLFNMLGAIGQFETELRKERQMEGIEKAKSRGVHFGRTKALTPAQADELRALRAQGVTLTVLMQRYGIGKTAVYRYLNGDGTLKPLGQPLLGVRTEDLAEAAD